MAPDDTMNSLKQFMHRRGVLGCAIYEHGTEGANGPLRLWGTWSPYAKTPADHREIADSLREPAQRCHERGEDVVMRPRLPDQLLADDGTSKWGFVMTSGAVRRAGCVVAMVLPAKDEPEVRAGMHEVERILQAKGGNR